MDQYIKSWSNLVDSSSSGTNYRIFKDSFEISKYIKFYQIILQKSYSISEHEIISCPLKLGDGKASHTMNGNVLYAIVISAMNIIILCLVCILKNTDENLLNSITLGIQMLLSLNNSFVSRVKSS